jgi:hypothetical protein
VKCAFAVFFWLALCASLSAQEPSTLPIESPPAASASLSAELNNLAQTLEQALIDSASDWEFLSETLTSLFSKLERLATLSRGLELENESMRKSLSDLGISLAEAQKEARHRNTELWLWRGAAVAGAAVAAALAWRR